MGIQLPQCFNDGGLLALNQRHLAVGGVVLVHHAGGEGLFALFQRAEDAAGQVDRAQDVLQHGLRDSAGPQDAGLLAGQGNHR